MEMPRNRFIDGRLLEMNNLAGIAPNVGKVKHTIPVLR
jgi:hypothetical protein